MGSGYAATASFANVSEKIVAEGWAQGWKAESPWPVETVAGKAAGTLKVVFGTIDGGGELSLSSSRSDESRADGSASIEPNFEEITVAAIDGGSDVICGRETLSNRTVDCSVRDQMTEPALRY